MARTKKTKIDNALSIDGKNLEGKYVLLNEKILQEKYRTLKNLVVMACCGFGCNPTSIGQAVFVQHFDGEECRYDRSEIVRFATDEEVAQAKAM